MPAIMLDSDKPSVLLMPQWENCRIATYADLLTPAIVAQAGPRLSVIHRGSGDPMRLATIADIEPGCLSVADGVALIRQWNAEKRQGVTAYHDRAMAGEVSAALAGEHCYRWVATLDGTLIPAGVSADVVQFADEKVLGFHADMSVVWDDAWRPLPSGPTAQALQDVKDAQAFMRQVSTWLDRAVKAL